MKTRRIESGWYEIVGSKDGYGQPYRVDHVDWRNLLSAPLSSSRRYWAVRDSRGREVSQHFTKRDAVASVEVTR